MDITIKIDINDIDTPRGVEGAILAYAEDSDDVASGVIGPSFATSGPGSGWSHEYVASDYARRALDHSYGARGYVDADDGRLAWCPDPDDHSAEYIEWSDESMVELLVPTADEALEMPEACAHMYEELNKHAYLTDVAAFHSLRAGLRALLDMID